MRVTLAYPYTGADGTTIEADQTVDLPHETAVELVAYGRARLPEDNTQAAPTPSTPAATQPAPAANQDGE